MATKKTMAWRTLLDLTGRVGSMPTWQLARFLPWLSSRPISATIHGRGNGDAFCAFDYGMNNSGYTYGTQVGLNPGLIQQGDVTIQRLVEAIHSSPVWKEGRNAIVIVWDENDYSGSTSLLTGLFPPQNQNRVVLTVQTNFGDFHGTQSKRYYNSFSLLKSMEAGFRLPCLNHACDPNVAVMSDLFGGGDE